MSQSGVCPDCGTELTRVKGRRAKSRPYLWCWKCKRSLRPGERRKAEHLALVPSPPKPKEWWLDVRVLPEQFDRARDALMYWEVGNDRSRSVISTADIAPDDVRRALTDDASGVLDCIGIEEAPRA